MKIYLCAICHEMNSAKRLQCQSCGTTPAEYSLIGKPSVMAVNADLYTAWRDINQIETVAAHGCLRLENTRTARVYMRTVPLDYYAN